MEDRLVAGELPHRFFRAMASGVYMAGAGIPSLVDASSNGEHRYQGICDIVLEVMLSLIPQ